LKTLRNGPAGPAVWVLTAPAVVALSLALAVLFSGRSEPHRWWPAAAQAGAGGAESAPPRRARASRSATFLAQTPSISVEPSFWYEKGPSCAGLARWSLPCAPAGTALRVAAATDDVVRSHPRDFPQPPPIDVVVRAHPADRRGRPQSIGDVYSYGGARLIDEAVVIDVNLVAFTGETPLNDAELRSFLAHELVHAYQYGHLGPAPDNSPELWQREVVAFEWELLHMEPGVRSWYRGEAIFNRDMYRRLLEEE
jgi:hypothetical protein